MTRLPTLAMGAVLLVSHPVAAQDDQPTRFAPNTDWALDYGEDYCRLMRGFAHQDDELTLVIDRIQPGPVVRMMISGTGLSTPRNARMLGFRLKPTEDPRETMILRARGEEGASVYNLGEVYLAPYETSRSREDQRALRGRYSRQDEIAYASQVASITFDTGVMEPIVLETGDLGPAVEALQACTDDLVAEWGLSEAQLRARRPVTPANDMSTWLPPGVIGREQTMLLMGGQNQVRLMIDAQGVPTDCAVHYVSLPEATNEAVCAALLENARFNPAQGSGGQPIHSYWITQLTYLAR